MNWLRQNPQNATISPRYDRDHLTNLFYSLQIVALVSTLIFVLLISLPVLQFGDEYLRIGLIIPVNVICILLLRKQRYDIAVWFFLLACWAIFVSAAVEIYGISGPLLVGAMLLILVGANSFLSHRAAYILLAIISLTNLVLAVAQITGQIPAHPDYPSPLSLWVIQTFFLIVAQFLMSDTIFAAREAFSRAQVELAERRKLEVLYQRAIRAADGVPYSYDFPTKRYTFMGEGIEKLTGYQAEEFSLDVLMSLIEHAEMHGDLAGRTAAEVRQSLQAGEQNEWRGDYRIRTRSGEVRWLNHSAILVRDNAQRPVGSIGILLDITQRKIAEASRVESENRFRAIFEKSVAGIVLMDFEGVILTANPAMCRLLEYTESELQKFRVSEITHPDDLPAELVEVEKLRRGESSYFQSEKRFIRRDGSSVWTRMTASLVMDAETLQGFGFMIVDDISQAKQVEAALQQRDAILEAVVFAGETFLKMPDWRMSIGDVLAGLGKETQASHAYIYENHTGPSGEWLTSMRYEWIAPGSTPGIDSLNFQNVPLPWPGVPGWQAAMEAGEAYIGSNKNLAQDEINISASLGIGSYVDVPILSGERFWGLIGFGHPSVDHCWTEVEVDALKIAASVLGAAIQRQQADQEILSLNAGLEQRVRTRTAELEASNHELESFAYSVSHDLRAPLRAIDGYSKLLALDYAPQLDANAAEMIDNMRQATIKMNRLIDDLLKLSRITRSQITVERVCLSDIAAGILKQLQENETHRKVETRVSPAIFAQGDANLLHVVMDNLLRNAWKFTNRMTPACIEFGRRNDPNEIVYYVRDNGAGFNMQYADKLFIPFQRLHGEQEFEGTGVGLATVRRIIQRHNGKVWAEAEAGKGATFYFTLGTT